MFVKYDDVFILQQKSALGCISASPDSQLRVINNPSIREVKSQVTHAH